MKYSLAIVVFLFWVLNAAAVVDEGTVTAVDGKGGFQVATARNGIITLEASRIIMGDEPRDKSKNWPDVYKSLRRGDFIEVRWGKDEKTGKPTAYGIAIKKRGG